MGLRLGNPAHQSPPTCGVERPGAGRPWYFAFPGLHAGPAPGADELEALASLHKRIDKNPIFQTVLKAAGLTTDDVVAVSMSQGGVLSLFIDDL